MTNKKILLVLIYSILACESNETAQQRISKKINSTQIKVEDFNDFLKRFSSDKKFQFSRTQFPLISRYYDYDTDSITTESTSKKEWEFSNLENKNYIMKLDKEHDKKYKVNIQIAETGVSVDYIFELIDRKWFLITTLDEST